MNLTRNQLEQRFGARFSNPPAYTPSYYLNAFDLPDLPVIPSLDPGSIRMFTWGLIPFWVKDAGAAGKIRKKTFNARMETIREKASYREAVKAKRCLVLCRGFYEWQSREKEKIPWYIYLKNEVPIAMAGLFEEWTDRDTGEVLQTCSIITTAANPMMEKIHNKGKRMPLILKENNSQAWIDPDLDADRAMKYLEPVDESEMDSHTISKLISKGGGDKNLPELVEPFSYGGNTLF